MINISMLGRMAVSIEGRRVALTIGSRGRLLAGYLIEFPGRVHRRDKLTDMFFEDHSAQQARAALNTVLWRLRKVMALDPDSNGADCIKSICDEIIFEPSGSMSVDTHSFETSAQRALDGLGTGERSACAASLTEAASTYTGSFLDGDDADWVIIERERLHSLYVRCLCELMRTNAAQGDYESAIAAGRRVLAADRFRETIVRSVAILLFLNGQRALAISELNRWQLALRAEIGVEPLPDTRDLRSALISGTICDQLPRWRELHSLTRTDSSTRSK